MELKLWCLMVERYVNIYTFVYSNHKYHPEANVFFLKFRIYECTSIIIILVQYCGVRLPP